jgi:hypothetical protein
MLENFYGHVGGHQGTKYMHLNTSPNCPTVIPKEMDERDIFFEV